MRRQDGLAAAAGDQMPDQLLRRHFRRGLEMGGSVKEFDPGTKRHAQLIGRCFRGSGFGRHF